MLTTRENLIDACKELQRNLGRDNEAIDTLDRKVKELYSNFSQSLEQEITKSNRTLQDFTQNSPLVQNASLLIASLTKEQDKLKQDVENLQKTNDFRSQYKTSLVVYVFGKVKTGKSSLGNYLILGSPDPTQEEINRIYSQPDAPVGYTVAVNENTGRLDNVEKLKLFKVGVTETTSTIQSYTLGGFTFVDSPGVHSITQSNEKLAKDYLGNADLVLFTESSNYPGRTSDSLEILDIVSHDISPIIVITRSDTQTQTWDKNTRSIIKISVPKSPQNRKQQEDAARKNLQNTLANPNSEKKQDNAPTVDFSKIRKERINNLQILSVSCLCAAQAKNEQEFKASGMSALLGLLKSTISSDGVRLKRLAPLNTFQNYLFQLGNTLDDFEQQITHLKDICKDSQKHLSQNLQQEIELSKSKLLGLINQAFNELNQERSQINSQAEAIELGVQGKLNSKLKELEGELKTACYEILDNVAKQLLKDFDSKALKFNLTVPNTLTEFKVTEEQFERYHYHESHSTRNSLIGAVLGGVVGSILGPIGTTLGAGVGAYLGSKTGEGGTSTEHVSVKTGDNFYEIKQQITEFISKEFEKEVNTIAQNMFNNMFKTFDSLLDEISFLIKDVKQQQSQLQAQINNLKRSL